MEEVFGLSKRESKRVYRPVVIAGQEYASVAEAARATGQNPQNIRERLAAGKSIEEAFRLGEDLNYYTGRKPVTFADVTYRSLAELAKAHNLAHGTFRQRLRCGWTIEQALEIEARPGSEVGTVGRVYKILHVSTGKVYIGITQSTIDKRWQRHISAANSSDRHSPNSLQAAIRLHGEAAFTRTQVAVAFSLDELTTLERKYIDEFQSLAPRGFNLVRGGYGVQSYGKSVTANGTTYPSLAAACREHNLTVACVRKRLTLGWGLEKALATSARRKRANEVSLNGVTYRSETELAKAFGVNPDTYRKRKMQGLSIEACLR
jgi:hypothetical protein